MERFRPIYKVVPLNLAVAGSQTIEFEGDQFHFFQALDTATLAIVQPATLLTLRVGSTADGDAMLLAINAKVTGRASRWIVSWAAQAGVTAFVVVSSIEGQSAFDLQSPAAAQLLGGTLNVSKAATLVDDTGAVGAGARATVIAANAARRTAWVSNALANANAVWVGTTALVNVNRGVECQPGETVFLDVTAAIGVWNPGAGAITLGFGELRD